jgi:hypothetical protein
MGQRSTRHPADARSIPVSALYGPARRRPPASVFHSLSASPVRDLHAVGGVGFRAIAKPSIVGYVDVGYGSEGAAVFSGINYPF